MAAAPSVAVLPTSGADKYRSMATDHIDLNGNNSNGSNGHDATNGSSQLETKSVNGSNQQQPQRPPPQQLDDVRVGGRRGDDRTAKDETYLVSKSATGFVGLNNQGATCYLNSLLQSLYMTPEFKKAIFDWKYDESKHGKSEECIPHQLQILFARLSQSNRGAVGTKELTTSFCWTNADSFRQHDVQELMRVLFTALEASSKENAANTSFINTLYEGALIDYVKCNACGTTRERKDTYLDLSLDVAENRTIEDALAHFIKAETLSGDNKYNCQVCATKVDAQKGLRIDNTPPILTVTLKRFVFDFAVLQRVKLHSELGFGETLDISPFLGENTSYTPFVPPTTSATSNGASSSSSSSASSSTTSSIASTTASTSADGSAVAGTTTSTSQTATCVPTNNGITGATFSKSTVPSNDDFLSPSTPALSAEQSQLPRGYPPVNPTYPKDHIVYDLFAVLMHSGTAMGGHYYAYIKSFEDNKWYEFNDSVVRPLPDWGLRHAFGGTRGGASAYMLIYRRKDDSAPIPRIVVPPELKKIIDAEDAKFKLEREAYEKEMRLLDVSVVYANKETRFRFDKGDTVATVTAAVRDKLGLTAFATDCLRLRRYAADIGWANTIFRDDASLDDNGFHRTNSLIVETRATDAAWPPFNPNDIPVRLRIVTLANLAKVVELSSFPPSLTDDIICIQVDKSSTFDSLRVAAAKASGLNEATIRLIRLHEAKAECLCDTKKTLQELGIQAGHLLYIEDEPRLVAAFETNKCQISIQFNTPVEGKDSRLHVDYDHTVVMSKNDTLSQLKDKIGRVIDIPSDSFRLARGRDAPQLKDDSKSLSELGFIDFSGVYVTNGRPLKAEEFSVKFYLYDQNASKSKFTLLFDLPVFQHLPNPELKKLLLSYLAKLKPDGHGGNGYGITHMRLRAKNLFQVDKILSDHLTLRANLPTQLDDGTEIAIQPIAKAESLGPNDRVISVQQFYPDTGKLSPLFDIKVRHMITVGAFKEAISLALVDGTSTASVTTNGSSAAADSSEATAAAAASSSSSSSSAAAAAGVVATTAAVPPNKMSLARGKPKGIALQWCSALDDSKTMRSEPMNMRGGDVIVFKNNETTPLERKGTRVPVKSATGAAAKRVGIARTKIGASGSSEVKAPKYRPIETGISIGKRPAVAKKAADSSSSATDDSVLVMLPGGIGVTADGEIVSTTPAAAAGSSAAPKVGH